MRPYALALATSLSLLSWLSSGVCASEPPLDSPVVRTPGADRPQVEAWIALLDESSAAARSAAMQQLVEAGPRILPWLPSLDDTASPGLRQSISELRNRLERDLARLSTEPSRVSLRGEFSLSSAIQELQEATGNQVSTQLLTDAQQSLMLNVDWTERPFWIAVQDLERQAGIELGFDPAAEVFAARMRIPTSQPFSATVGPARLVMGPPQFRPLADDSGADLLRIEGRLQLEPRLRPLLVQLRMSDWTATKRDRVLSAWNPDAEYELDFPEGTSEIRLPLDFRLPREATALWSLTGKVTLHLAAGQESLEFAGSQLRRGISQRRGGVSVRMQQARFDQMAADQLQAAVRIVVNYDQGGPAFESHRLGLFSRAAWLGDQEGRRYAAARCDVTAEADGGIGLEYRFESLPGKPVDYRFIYEAPTLLLAVPLTFSLENLLPPARPAE